MFRPGVGVNSSQPDLQYTGGNPDFTNGCFSQYYKYIILYLLMSW